MKNKLIGYPEAIATTLAAIQPLGTVPMPLFEAVDHIVAEDLHAKVNSPSVDASLKDGYAVISDEISKAGPENQITLM